LHLLPFSLFAFCFFLFRERSERAVLKNELQWSGRTAESYCGQGYFARVLRGGSWNNQSRNCRAANRNRNAPANRNYTNGFRAAFRLHFRLPDGKPRTGRFTDLAGVVPEVLTLFQAAGSCRPLAEKIA
jgi:hypothetical protein